MSDSLARWLHLREPTDWAARSEALARAIAAQVAAAEPVHVLDLATGTGSNVRYLAERLPGRQHWLAVDRDPTLLAALPVRLSSWGAARGYEVHRTATGCLVRGSRLECHVETRQLDLGTLDDAGLFAGRQLVTASALLDLVSPSWLRALAAHCREVGAAALFALTYDGRSSCVPPEPDDDMVRDLFNRHQHRDKGLGGAAAGPEAVECAQRCFAEAGFSVHRAPSDWTIGPDERQFQQELIDGWAGAATEVDRARASTIARWQRRRLAHVEAGRSSLTVCHYDLAAWRERA